MAVFRSRSQVWVFLLLLTQVSHGLSPPSSRLFLGDCKSLGSIVVRIPSSIVALSARGEDKDDEFPFPLDLDADTPIIIRGSDDDDIDGSIWEDAETGQPPEWLVMKELLGINIFTYILAALIAFFLSMNFFIGPGWLGAMLGIPGTGSFQEVSDSLPDTIDLSSPEFRL